MVESLGIIIRLSTEFSWQAGSVVSLWRLLCRLLLLHSVDFRVDPVSKIVFLHSQSQLLSIFQTEVTAHEKKNTMC